MARGLPRHQVWGRYLLRNSSLPVATSIGLVLGYFLTDWKSTHLNSSHTDIYTLSLHDALPIYGSGAAAPPGVGAIPVAQQLATGRDVHRPGTRLLPDRLEEHTSELQSHRYLHSFPTRRSSDLWLGGCRATRCGGDTCCATARYRSRRPSAWYSVTS